MLSPPSRKLYVTLDVVFHENDMYYSESSLQRENRDEVQTLRHPLDNLDFIKGDNLEASGECPSDGNTMDNREEYPGETGDGPESDGNTMDNREECPGETSDGLEFF